MNHYLGNVFSVAPNVSRISGIGSLLGIAINVAMGVGISVSVIYIGLAGIRYMTSQGDPKATQQAKQALTYSIVAMVLSIGALAVKAIILGIAGVVDPDLTGGTPTF